MKGADARTPEAVPVGQPRGRAAAPRVPTLLDERQAPAARLPYRRVSTLLDERQAPAARLPYRRVPTLLDERRAPAARLPYRRVPTLLDERRAPAARLPYRRGCFAGGWSGARHRGAAGLRCATMITVTDPAFAQLRVLVEEKGELQKGLRIFVESGGCAGMQYGMALDDAQAGDEVFEQDGVKVLVDPQSLEFLRGSTVDYSDDLAGAGFRIHNPNAVRSCGCGTSFEAPAGAFEAPAGAVEAPAEAGTEAAHSHH